MIVPSMSKEEIWKEFLHDFHIAEAKAIHTYKQLEFDMRKRHQAHAIQLVSWKSPLHNTWMSFYRMGMGQTNVLHVCITMDQRDLLKALTLMGDGAFEDYSIGEYNIHFYKRYNERMKLNLPNPMQIVKYYYKHNFSSENYTELSRTDDPGSMKVFIPVNGGVLLGYHYTDKKWFEIKTFVSDEMLRESQMEKVEYLKNYKMER